MKFLTDTVKYLREKDRKRPMFVDMVISGCLRCICMKGACMTLLSVRVYYVTCDVTTSGFARFPATPSGPEPTSLVAVDGRCVAGATVGGPGPRGHCTADGRLVLVAGGCQCRPGYQPSRRLPNVCVGT